MKVLKRYTKRLAPVAVAFALLQGLVTPANAATLTSASTLISNSTPSAASTTYTITASGVTLAAVKCLRVEFDTQADGAGGMPAGMSIASVALSGTSTYVPTPASWSAADAGSGVAQVTLAGGETPASASNRTVVLTGITNPNTATTYYVRFNTYNNTDCSTSPVDSVVMSAVTTNNTVVSVVVDPTLTFTVADNAAANCNGVSENGTSSSPTAVNLGRASTATNRFQAQELHASTNAAGGYTVYAKYPAGGAMSDGNGHTITDWTGLASAPTATWLASNEYFGYTTDDATLSGGTPARFTAGGAKFAGLSTTNAEVHYNNGPVDESSSNFACIGWQVGISGTTEAGNYSATVIYTAVPVF